MAGVGNLSITGQGLGIATSIGPNRIDIFTWRREQSQLPKRSSFYLEYWTID
jgi:hypothetical protein